jgi:GNAT superfamily N-acetyltransferase
MSGEPNPSISRRAERSENAADCPGSNNHGPDYCRNMKTADGLKVTIRPITFADKNKLQEFHARLSGATRFLRYQYAKGDLTERDLHSFCDVDYDNTLGLVAETGENGRRHIVGVGRYARLPDPKIAEIAFVVQDSEQKKGIGTQLLRHLSILAWERGIRYFVGELLRENGRMINILRKSDPGMRRLIEGSSFTITVKVEDAKANIPAGWSAAEDCKKQGEK